MYYANFAQRFPVVSDFSVKSAQMKQYLSTQLCQKAIFPPSCGYAYSLYGTQQSAGTHSNVRLMCSVH